MTTPRAHLVTGAGSGIGAALVGALHERGDALVLLARSRERADDLAATYPGATTLVADLADPPGLERALAEADLPDSLDSVVHVAGAVDLAPLAELDLADWQRQLDVNLTAPALVTRAALPALRAARGLVLFVNSGAGLAAHPDWSAYAASKFGLRALADALRGEEKPARRAGHHGLPRPHRHPDAGEGPPPGGPGLRRLGLDRPAHGRRDDPPRPRPAPRRHHPRGRPSTPPRAERVRAGSAS